MSVSSSSYLHDRAAVRTRAEIGLLSLRLSFSQGASLGDFLLAPACPIDKVTLWEGFLYLTSGSETDEGVAKDKVFARTGNRTLSSEGKTTLNITKSYGSKKQQL